LNNILSNLSTISKLVIDAPSMDKIILDKYNVDILISGILHKNQSGKTIKDKRDYHIKYPFFQKTG